MEPQDDGKAGVEYQPLRKTGKELFIIRGYKITVLHQVGVSAILPIVVSSIGADT